jgi:hypothetical protein
VAADVDARPRRLRAPARRAPALLAAALAACQSSAGELSGLAKGPPLDYSVLVTGGTFREPAAADGSTFTGYGSVGDELLPIEDVVAVLRDGAVFQRTTFDGEKAHRTDVLTHLQGRGSDPALLAFLQQTRDEGHDLLLVIERLQDGPIDGQGINGRWPVTLATWFLLGVGMFIPDHTFESRARLSYSLRDLQTGRVVHDQLLFAQPVDLSLVERGSFLGILLSIIVPPFWVANDDESVTLGVREVTARRLLLQLASELKSESTRQKLRDNAVAAISLAGGTRLRIDAQESISAVRLRLEGRPWTGSAALDFERELLASLRRVDARFAYEAELPPDLAGRTAQVLVGTLTGRVASVTLAVGARR